MSSLKKTLLPALGAVALAVSSSFWASSAVATGADVIVTPTCHGYTAHNPRGNPVVFMAGVSSQVAPEVTVTIAPGATYAGSTSTVIVHWEANDSSGQFPAGFGDFNTETPCTPIPEPTATPTATPSPTPTDTPTATPTPEPTATPTPTSEPTPATTTPATTSAAPAPAVVPKVAATKKAPATHKSPVVVNKVTEAVPGTVQTD
jgi:hypothetical protein